MTIRRGRLRNIGQVANVSSPRPWQASDVEIGIEVTEHRPLAGRLWANGRPAAEFAGWLDLLARLERLLREERQAAPSGPTREATPSQPPSR